MSRIQRVSKKYPKLNDLGAVFAAPRYSECFSNLACDRTVFLCEDITKPLASELGAMLIYLDQQNEEDIKVYVDTSGGDAQALCNILDIMNMVKSDISTICIGKAFSAGAFILSAGAPGKRYMLRHSMSMIHGIQAGVPSAVDHLQSENYIEFLKKHNNQLLKLLASRTNKTAAEVIKDCERDVWLDARQSVEYGLADHIL